MTHRPLTVAGVLVATLVLSSCSGPAIPDREPNATGVVSVAAGGAGPRVVDAVPERFEGMDLAGADDHPVVVDGDGVHVQVDDLADGDEVEIWIEGECGTSSPVQCEVVAIRIAD
ncbi:hypothetical protein OCAE111667_23975 [Occultella aeris]|uniref:Lipoprotein n=1 Tax=Occultella aeris TaxID=2761496 RepID=A0A7M4DLI3_9MICO|nr:hypothetical protein [Occultella aeris]VZO38143.1 hypothetical protein HALOF300_03000 [Occultella aeris]